MKKIMLTTAVSCLSLLSIHAAEQKQIRISTDNTDLILQVEDNGRLYQSYFGEKLLNEQDLKNLSWNIREASDQTVTPYGWEVYSCSGNDDYFEPALSVTHNDGNMTSYLYYQSSSSQPVEGGIETIINLKDDKYPLNVTLHYIAYTKEDVIKAWSEISHQEKNPLILSSYASTMLYFNAPSYYLTEFSSDWAKEVRMSSQQLQFGKKVIDTKLGSRAAMLVQPFFEVGINQPVEENQGQVLMGTLGWTGNFRFTFEVDNKENLRVIPAINPYASNYELKKNEVFKTPEFIFTLSQQGSSLGSRNLHQWARNYGLKDGKGSRMSLLNNWENTGFNFNQDILSQLMKEAKDLGVDMFLLDDGWFGNKYPRKNDGAGLGDWEVTHDKLPGGVPALVDAAKQAGVKFGIWIEPEMVNPKSELFEKHPDWVIKQNNRETYYFRNQLVLDLSNPKVQDYVYGIVEDIMVENPDVAFFKWDCNSPITNIYSPYNKDKQGQLYIDHVRGLYKILERVKENYPNVPMMLCSGGGGRCDYEALKYFTEFWCSDNTDPIERIFIQWGFSQFFPAKAMCAHVTSWNRKASIKFRTDVASMCKLGFDLGLKDLSKDELSYCKTAVANWERLQNTILDGTQYRLVSPYQTNHMALNYVNEDKSKAVLFAYDIHPRFQEKIMNVKLQGLDPSKNYKVEEINLMPSSNSRLQANNKVFSGDYLMKVGIKVLGGGDLQSYVVELTAQ
ncbi:MAG: alpha-galactosidase [Bacteroidales bacterium]|nr:alpha-galactosidase [Bacteroidales bacterium]